MREELENGMELAQSIHQAALDTGFDNCGILALDDMESFADRVTERMDAVPDSRAFYEGIRRNADIRKRFPWAKSLSLTVNAGCIKNIRCVPVRRSAIYA